MTDTKQVELRSKSLQDFQFAMVSDILNIFIICSVEKRIILVRF